MTAAAYDTDLTNTYDFRITGQNLGANTDHILMNNTRATVKVHVDHAGGSQYDVRVTLGPGEGTTYRSGAAGNNSTVYGYVNHSAVPAQDAATGVDDAGASVRSPNAVITHSPF